MNFLRRKVRASESASAAVALASVQREIEIHVEREWVSITARPTAESNPNLEACPLCGHHLASTTTYIHGVLADGHPAAHGSCPGVLELQGRIEPQAFEARAQEFGPAVTKLELL